MVVKGETVSEPFKFFEPDQPTDAEQEFALFEYHESTDVCPCVMLEGFAVNVTVGNVCCEFTNTVACANTEPPEPLHVILYVVVMDGYTVSEPFKFLLPYQPPFAVQVVVFPEYQFNIELCP